jgi:glycine cleavage system H protein
MTMRFSASHEWVRIEDKVAVIGVTDHAQHELGEVVYVELPKIGKEMKAGEQVAVLESTKAAADVYTPVSGRVLAVNEALKEDASLINKAPEERGWIAKLQLEGAVDFSALMDFAEYSALLQQAKE